MSGIGKMFTKTIFLSLFLIFLTDSQIILSQNPTINGYRGIWFSTGSQSEFGYKISGGTATFTPHHRPAAIYSPEARKTFFVYGGTTDSTERHLLIMVSYFDHITKKVPKSVVVLDKMGVREPYDNASIQIDSDGYLWIFVSGRGRTRPGFIFKGAEPYSINRFEEIRKVEMNLPQPWFYKNYGFLLLFSKRTNGRELYFSTSRDGKAWSENQKIAGFGGHYQISGKTGDKITTVFNYHPGGDSDRRTNLYVLQSEDMGKSWTTISGERVEIPLLEINNPALVRDFLSENKLVHIHDINFDKNGNPVILILLSNDVFPGTSGHPREWMIVCWNGNKWNFHKVCESTHNYDLGSLFISDKEWKIIGPTEPGPQKYGTGGEIALWISNNEGADWKKVRNLTENSIYNHSFVRHPVNEQKDFYAFWADGDADKLSPSRLYFTNEKCDKVWVLPYEMTRNLIKPRRIK